MIEAFGLEHNLQRQPIKYPMYIKVENNDIQVIDVFKIYFKSTNAGPDILELMP
jgi:hypothetical protein